jgi:hypothetical protein
MSAVKDRPAYSIGKGKRSFKLCNRDQSVPGPASYSIDRDFHKEAVSSSLAKDKRLQKRLSSSPGPGTYDIQATIGSVTTRLESVPDLNSPKSDMKTPGRTLSTMMSFVSNESHPIVKNSPKAM